MILLLDGLTFATITPPKTNMEPEIPPWRRGNIYRPAIFGFHVSFRGCSQIKVFKAGFWKNNKNKVCPQGHKVVIENSEVLQGSFDVFTVICSVLSMTSPKQANHR